MNTENGYITSADALSRLFQNGFFSRLDFFFARFISEVTGGAAPEVVLAAALVSKYTAAGHMCLNLASMAGEQLGLPDDGQTLLTCPSLGRWRDLIAQSPAVGMPGAGRPLILDGKDRLYLYRYWDYETKLARALIARVRTNEAFDTALLRDGLNRLFPPADGGECDWQRIAAATAVIKNVTFISGGPGTGKTTTVVKILALLLEQAGRPLQIALVAPTGKAAARLQEAVLRSKANLACDQSVSTAIPAQALTIHRLLGAIPYSCYFRHDCRNQLPLDVIVVDETSMVSLPLMAKLVDAVPERCRLVFLGDKDQLGSVEAGAALGSICTAAGIQAFSRNYCRTILSLTGDTLESSDVPEGQCLQDCLVHLKKNYRFSTASGVGNLSEAVRQGDADTALSLLHTDGHRDIGWSIVPSPSALARSLRDIVLQGYQPYLRAETPEEALALFDRFRILAVVREGPYGVMTVGAMVEDILRHEHLIRPEGRWYAGRPIMILRNNYQLRLFNGDVGLILPDPAEPGELRAFFPAGNGQLRSLSPARLPEHETVFAMTVHKSQGSEFDDVLFIVPPQDLPLLSRELVYTAITRTRRKITVWAAAEVLKNGLSRRIERTSGLLDALW